MKVKHRELIVLITEEHHGNETYFRAEIPFEGIRGFEARDRSENEALAFVLEIYAKYLKGENRVKPSDSNQGASFSVMELGTNHDTRKPKRWHNSKG